MSVNTEYTYTMDISKISAIQIDITMSLSDATGVLSTHTVSDNGADLGTDAPYDDFDFVHIRWSNQIETRILSKFGGSWSKMNRKRCSGCVVTPLFLILRASR